MAGGPEIADIIKRGNEEEVEEHKPKQHDEEHKPKQHDEEHKLKQHHEDTNPSEKKFRNEVIALRDVLDEHGNLVT